MMINSAQFNKFITKLHHDDLMNIISNENLIYQDLEYANHINSRSIIFDFIRCESKELFLLSKIVTHLQFSQQHYFVFSGL